MVDIPRIVVPIRRIDDCTSIDIEKERFSMIYRIATVACISIPLRHALTAVLDDLCTFGNIAYREGSFTMNRRLANLEQWV